MAEIREQIQQNNIELQQFREDMCLYLRNVENNNIKKIEKFQRETQENIEKVQEKVRETLEVVVTDIDTVKTQLRHNSEKIK